MASIDEVIQVLEAKLDRALKAKRKAQRKAGCAIEWLRIIKGDVGADANDLRDTAKCGLDELMKIK